MRRPWLLVVLLLGCRVAPAGENPSPPPALDGSFAVAPPDDTDPTPAAVGGEGGSSPSGVAGRSSPNPAAGPQGGEAARSRPSTESADESGNAGAAGGGEPVAANDAGGSTPAVTVCDAQRVSFDEIRAGAVRTNVRVRLDAVATSQKFLLSHAHSGSCLFAAFLGDEPASDGPRGVLVVSYGPDAPEGETCATGRDAIPDELTPGDVVSGIGTVASYAPSSCSVAPSTQLMVDAGCSLSRTGRRVLPAPFVLTPEQADAIAAGADASLVRRFAAGLVRLENVSAVRPKDGTGSVAPYGVIHFAETNLELHNDLEYGDLSGAGPGDPEKSLVFPYPTEFSAVTGLVHLDYCTWSLTERSRCTDLDPKSSNCD